MSIVSESFEALKDYPVNEDMNDVISYNKMHPGSYSRAGNANMHDHLRRRFPGYNPSDKKTYSNTLKDYVEHDKVTPAYSRRDRIDDYAWHHENKADSAKRHGDTPSEKRHMGLASKARKLGGSLRVRLIDG